MYEATEVPAKKERIKSAISDVISRVEDMREMEQVNLQYMISIDLTRQSNNRLGQSVYRTITPANNIVMVGLAIQSALIRQRRVHKAAIETRAFLGDLVASNASAIKRHTQEVGDIYNSPVIAMDKTTQAHEDLLEALQIASQQRQEGIELARVNIAELRRMSAKLEEKMGGAIDAETNVPQSLEA